MISFMLTVRNYIMTGLLLLISWLLSQDTPAERPGVERGNPPEGGY